MLTGPATAVLSAQQPWITGYYSAGNGNLSVAQIPWSKYTHVIHFAASTDGAGNVIPYYLTAAEMKLMTQSNPPGTKVLVAIKDNDNNLNYFPQSAATATFAANIAKFVSDNGYDGVDLDWEKNINVANFDKLLKDLRAAMPDKVITMAGNGNNYQVAKDSNIYLDQVNVMCYDLDWGNSSSWFVGALWQGSDGNYACDWDVRNFTTPSASGVSVPASKIGVGMPYYGRRWPRVTQPLDSSASWRSATTFYYRDLVTDSTRWVDSYKKWDGSLDATGAPVQNAVHGADYLSIPSLNEFDSYTGSKFLQAATTWGRNQGFGGFMTFTIEYEHLSAQTCNAAYPLSTVLFNDANPNAPAAIPTVLSASTASNRVQLSWSACGGASYNVYRSASPDSFSGIPYATVSGTSYTDTAASNGSTYFYFVTALDANGNLAGNSNQISATPVDTSSLPLPPTNLTASSPAKRQVNIAWTAPSDATSATKYEVWRGTISGGPYKYIDTTSATSYANLGMASGTTYYYVVRAMNAAGVYSPYSNEAYATAR